MNETIVGDSITAKYIAAIWDVSPRKFDSKFLVNGNRYAFVKRNFNLIVIAYVQSARQSNGVVPIFNDEHKKVVVISNQQLSADFNPEVNDYQFDIYAVPEDFEL